MSTQQLFYALNREDLDEARLLLDAGVDVNVVLPEEGVAPLHLAAGLGTDAIKLLLEYAADPNIRSVEGFTPLHIAATWGEVENVRLLLYSGADPNLCDQDGFLPADVAKTYGHSDCVCLLKYYSLLLFNNEQEDEQPKYIRKSIDRSKLSDIAESKDSMVHDISNNWNNGFLDSPPTNYTDVFQKQVYDSVQKGRNIFVDMTSPCHPTIHTRQAAGRECKKKKASCFNRRKTLKISSSHLSNQCDTADYCIPESYDYAEKYCGLNKVKARGENKSNVLCSCCDDHMTTGHLYQNNCQQHSPCGSRKQYFTKKTYQRYFPQPVSLSPNHHDDICTAKRHCDCTYQITECQQCHNNCWHYEYPVIKCDGNKGHFYKSSCINEMVNKRKTPVSNTISSPPIKPFLESIQRETPEAKINRWQSSGVFDSKPILEIKPKTKKWFQPLTDDSECEPANSTVDKQLFQCLEKGKRFCLDVTSPNHPFLDTKSFQFNVSAASSAFDSSNSLFSQSLNDSNNDECGIEESLLVVDSPNISPAVEGKPPVHPLKRCSMTDIGGRNNNNKNYRSRMNRINGGMTNGVLNDNLLQLHRFLIHRQTSAVVPQQEAEIENRKENILLSPNCVGTADDDVCQRKQDTKNTFVKQKCMIINSDVQELDNVQNAEDELDFKGEVTGSLRIPGIDQKDVENRQREVKTNVISDGNYVLSTHQTSSKEVSPQLAENQISANSSDLSERFVNNEESGDKDVGTAAETNGSRLSEGSILSASSCDTFKTCDDDTEFTIVTHMNNTSEKDITNSNVNSSQTEEGYKEQKDRVAGNNETYSVSELQARPSHCRVWSAPELHTILDDSNLTTSDESFLNPMDRNKLQFQTDFSLLSQRRTKEPHMSDVTKNKEEKGKISETLSRKAKRRSKNVFHRQTSLEALDLNLSQDNAQKLKKNPSKKLFPDVFELKNKSEKQKHKWQPPVNVTFDESDLMTSDESFLLREKMCYENITKLADTFDKVCVETEEEQKKGEHSSLISVNNSKTDAAKSLVNKRLSTMNSSSVSSSTDALDVGFCKRTSLDSVYSNLSCKEYVYKDDETGVVLLERHIPSDHEGSIDRNSIDSLFSIQTADTERTELYDWKAYQSDQNESTDEKTTTQPTSSVPDQLSQMSNDEVRKKLKALGDEPGPVVPCTRQLYLVRLASLQSDPYHLHMVKLTDSTPDYSPELRLALQDKLDLSDTDELEAKMVAPFVNPQGRKWREGTIKSSFNYLLLDPRVTKNLPLRAKYLGELETFRVFIAAIFYVGKGKRSRPYSHLYEAITHMQKPKTKASAKVQHIVDIWQEGVGVVSLHCFQSTIPVEAYTREACMVEAFGLSKLTNMKKGDFYGAACSWSQKQKRLMGVLLLKKALQIFLSDGERQICPYDIKQG